MTIARRLYSLLIAPRQRDEDARNREVVLNTLLAGTVFITLLALLLLASKVIFLGDTYLIPRVAVVAGFLLFVAWMYWLSRRGRFKTASYLLTAMYFLFAFALTYIWGANVPTGILLYGLVIVMAGILLGPKYSLYAAALVAAVLCVLVLVADGGHIDVDLSWATTLPGLVDVAGFSFVFGTIALMSWLFNHQMARSLHKAERAEAELLKQKELLEIKVLERTRELETAQLEKIQQMYRFAELGQLSTALMHELANHLTSLTLDIEGLQGQGRSRAVSRAKRSIRYIDDMVVRVREQLHGKGRTQTFGVVDEVDAIVKMLRHKAQIAGVSLQWRPPDDGKNLRVTGEPIRLRQLMANLISNGIDAYYPRRDDIDEKRDVEVSVSGSRHHVVITVNDWGRGIPKQHCDKLFEPFFSTKKTGMGMGLYIAQQVAVEHFLGDIKVTNPSQPTSFVITLPKA